MQQLLLLERSRTCGGGCREDGVSASWSWQWPRMRTPSRRRLLRCVPGPERRTRPWRPAAARTRRSRSRAPWRSRAGARARDCRASGSRRAQVAALVTRGAKTLVTSATALQARLRSGSGTL